MVGLKASLLLLALSILPAAALAALPPAFPWESSQMAVSFSEVQTGFPISNARVEMSVEYGNASLQTILRTDANGSALLYLMLPPGTQSVTATAEVLEPDGTPAYLSTRATLSNPSQSPQSIQMVPVGLVSGSVLASNGSGVPASVIFSCENSALPAGQANSSANGEFGAILPAGRCSASVSIEHEDGSAEFSVEKGKTANTTISLVRKPPLLEELSASPNKVFILFMGIVAVAAVVAFLAYYYIMKKGRGGKKPALVLLSLMLLPLLPGAATLSMNTTGITHTYDLQLLLGHVPTLEHATITLVTDSIDGCSGRTIVELSDDGANFASIGSATTVSPQPFTMQLSSLGSHRYYRLRNGECWLKSSTLVLREEADLVPTVIHIYSTDGAAAPENGIPARIVAEISNHGGALDPNTTRAVIVSFYADAFDDAHKLGEVRLGPDSPAWAENGSTDAEVIWAPPSVGMHTVYANVSVSPPEADANASNNLISTGLYIGPAPTEQRATTGSLSSSPASAVLGATPTLLLRAAYMDVLTQQPVLGANCTISAQGAIAEPVQMVQNDTAYTLTLDSSSLGVGVYEFTASCSKPGYAPLLLSYPLPMSSPGGQVLQVFSIEGSPRGEFAIKRASLGVVQRLKVRVERGGPESVGVKLGTLKVNGFTADSFASDGRAHDGYTWLEAGTSYAEWTFGKDSITSDTLSIIITPTLMLNWTAASSTPLYVTLIPVQALCTRRSPGLQISPSEQTGEVGTPLYYEITVTNRDGPECDPTTFELVQREGYEGWVYGLSSTRVPAMPGHSNLTFLSVTPPFGEQPGRYRFRFNATPMNAEDHEADLTSFAEAYYTVSSPKLFAGLSAGVEGNGTLAALPGASASFFARYYDLHNSTIGTCRISSELMGSLGVEMRQENGTSTLMADISEKQPGLYPYLITCEAEGYKPLAFAGNLTIAAPQGQYRIPSVSAAPAAQLASAGHATSYLVEVRGNSECNGTQTISLSAEPPAGWNASFEKDSLSVPCGGSRSTALTISIPENAQPGVRMIPMTAALADAPEFAKRIFVSAGLAEGAALPLSCLSGGALESQSNLAASDDPCWNWNENQTYNLGTPVAGTLYVAGESALPSCTQPVQLEGSNDSVSFTPLAQAQPEASGSFTLSSQIPAYRFVRVRSGCMLRATSLLFSPSQPQEAQQPDLLIAGVRFPAELRQGEPALATLVVRNAGPSIYSQYQSTLSMRGSDGSITPLDIVTTYSHASGQDLAVEFVFTPQALGAYELVFTADSSNDINESNESNNAFAVTGVTVSAQPSESLSVSLAPGWNAVPFLYGVPISTDCSGEALLRLGEGDYAQLDPQMLHFVSETEASDFTIAHGTAASPRTALAFGGAWYYADSGCTITYALASTPLPLRSSEAGLDVPAGGAMLTVLPWMSENTIPNVLGTCEPKRVSVWDASGQKWVEFNGAITPEMVGSVIAVRSGTPCHLG